MNAAHPMNRRATRAAPAAGPDGIATPDLALALARNNRAATRYAGGDYVSAVADLDHALGLRPEYPEALNNRGAARLALGDLDAARADLDRALELRPDYPEALDNRAAVRRALGDEEGALADLDRAIGLVPDRAAAPLYHSRGGIHLGRRDYDAALADLDHAIRLAPRLWPAYITRGNARYHKRDAAALDDYGMALLMSPEEATRELVRKLASDLGPDARAALLDCERHLRRDPGDRVSRARRALSYLLLGRDGEALADLEELALRCPEWAGHLGRLAAEARARRSPAASRPVAEEGSAACPSSRPTGAPRDARP